MIFNLRKKLEEWVRSELISPKQAQSILHYEAVAKSTGWILYGITGIGATALASGIISLIAANWMAFSATFKLCVYFLVHGAVGAGFIPLSDRPGPWRETLLILFAVFFLAGIGLVSQIYHLHSAPWKAAVFFVALTFPLSQLGNSRTLTHGWVLASFFACGTWAADGQPGSLRWEFFTAYPVLLTALSFFLERWGIHNRVFRSAILIWGVGFSLLVGSVCMNLIWLESKLVGSAFLTAPARLIPELSIVAVALASLARGPQVAFSQRVTTALLFLVHGAFFFLPLEFSFDSMSRVSRQIIGSVGFLAVWALAAGAAAQAGYRRLFDFASFVIAVRFIVIYFEVFGSLTQTGFGLIFSGAVILSIAGVWAKFRGGLRTFMGGAREI